MTRHIRAFTLLEVVLGAAILCLAAGGIFGCLQAILGGVGEQMTLSARAAESDSLTALLKRTFSTLPPAARLTLDAPGPKGTAGELAIEEAPEAFSWGVATVFPGRSVLRSVPRSDGTLALELLQYHGVEPEPAEAPARTLRLATGLRTVRWEFFDTLTRHWLGAWENRARRPDLVRVELRFSDEPDSRQVTFSLPWTAPDHPVLSYD